MLEHTATTGSSSDIGVHQELAPGPLHRHRLHLAPIGGKPAVLDQAPRGEQVHRPSVGGAVERHGEVQVSSVHPERRAGDRHALRVAGELELRRGGPQRREIELAVAENEDLAVGHPPMHPSRHLENLVGSEIEAVEHVAAALDHVAVTRVVDDDGVEAGHVQRGLTRRRHREQERPLDLPLEKRSDHPDRLAAVIERGRETLPLLTQLLAKALDLGAGGDETRPRRAAP